MVLEDDYLRVSFSLVQLRANNGRASQFDLPLLSLEKKMRTVLLRVRIVASVTAL